MEKIFANTKTIDTTVYKAIKNMQSIVVDNTSIKSVVEKAIEIHGDNADLNFIDVSNVTDMNALFYHSKFNGDISKWNVSNVTNMNYMFADSIFNGDISNWDVSNVTHMNYMFADSKFNGDISKWNVSNVINMSWMFDSAEFNGDISNWNTASIKDMCNMFYNSHFNSDISNWNVSNVIDMCCMFEDSQFNGDISKWNVSKVEDMRGMFNNSSFNGDISNWDVSNVTHMNFMFEDSQFNGDISKWNFDWKYIVPQNLKIGYKKVNYDYSTTCIAVLELPSDSIKIHLITAHNKKCRTNKCKVIGFKDLDGNDIEVKEAFSSYDPCFKYHLNDEIEIKDFDTNIWNECSTGIHFFENFTDAVNY